MAFRLVYFGMIYRQPNEIRDVNGMPRPVRM